MAAHQAMTTTPRRRRDISRRFAIFAACTSCSTVEYSHDEPFLFSAVKVGSPNLVRILCGFSFTPGEGRYRDIVTKGFGRDDKPIESLKALSYKQLCRLVDILGRMGAVYALGTLLDAAQKRLKAA